MATAYKILGQAALSNNVHTTLYTVPAANSAVISTINITNLTANTAYVSLTAHPANATPNIHHYLTYNLALATADSLCLTLGITLSATDTLRANIFGNCAVSIFGSEVY